MNNSVTRITAAAAAGVLALGLAGCSGGSEPAASGAAGGGPEACAALTPDLETARQAVLDGLAEDDSLTQIMLAGDVEAPTQKYGLLVMPFVKSDAAEKVTGTVNIDGGNFVVEAEDAEGLTCQIDQDGTISEAAA
ncbi:MAG: hypothetical protein ACK5LS_07020 [Propioniciclava sp.]